MKELAELWCHAALEDCYRHHVTNDNDNKGDTPPHRGRDSWQQAPLAMDTQVCVIALDGIGVATLGSLAGWLQESSSNSNKDERKFKPYLEIDDGVISNL